MTIIRGFFLLLSVLMLSGCTSLTSMLFYPDTQYYRTPDQFNIQYEKITLQSSDGEVLQHWLLLPSQPPKASILFLHGNGENISTHMGSVAWLTKHGYEVFLMDYRGYGQSSGVATLANTMADIQVTHQWLSMRQQRPIVLFGQSMGGALAISYAGIFNSSLSDDGTSELRPFSAVISESAPASWPQVAREAMRQHWLTWILQLPASLLTNDYDAEKHIGSITTPLLLMHSPSDNVVAFHHVEQLQANANPDTQLLITQGAHIAGMANAKIRDQVLDFIAENIER